MTGIDIDWSAAFRVFIPAVTGIAGVLGGYLLAEKNGLRSVEAAYFAAGALKGVCSNVLADVEDDAHAQDVATSYVAANSLEICRDIVAHVRATDLPESIRIDTVAQIQACIRFTEAAMSHASMPFGTAAHLRERMTEQIEMLDPILIALETEERRLQRPILVKALDRLNPFKKR